MSPGQNFLPNLTDEEEAAGISVSMALVSRAARPQPPAPHSTQRRAHRSSGEAQPTALEVQTAQSHKLFAQSHLKGASHAPGELQATIPYGMDSLLPCCAGGTTLQFTTCLESGWPLVLTPYSAAGGQGTVEHIPSSSSAQEQQLCSDALKPGANPTSFLKNNPPFLVCQLPSPHPLCLQPSQGTTRDKGHQRHRQSLKWQTCIVSPWGST